MNPRTPITQLELVGSPNLKRAREYAEKDAAKPPLTDTQRAEVEQLDILIQECFKACARGQTRRGKRNPSFANLQALVKTRKTIIEGRQLPPAEKTPQELVSEIDRMLATAGEHKPS
jgi:hypothetical protein